MIKKFEEAGLQTKKGEDVFQGDGILFYFKEVNGVMQQTQISRLDCVKKEKDFKETTYTYKKQPVFHNSKGYFYLDKAAGKERKINLKFIDQNNNNQVQEKPQKCQPKKADQSKKEMERKQQEKLSLEFKIKHISEKILNDSLQPNQNQEKMSKIGGMVVQDVSQIINQVQNVRNLVGGENKFDDHDQRQYKILTKQGVVRNGTDFFRNQAQVYPVIYMKTGGKSSLTYQFKQRNNGKGRFYKRYTSGEKRLSESDEYRIVFEGLI